MVKRDERKFRKADTDNDGKLTKEEFAAFLHPEEHEHMKDIVVLVSLVCLLKTCQLQSAQSYWAFSIIRFGKKTRLEDNI